MRLEIGRVRGEGEVVAVAETWGERCCTVGMWDMFSNFSVWITAHRPSNLAGPGLHHRLPRTVWSGLVRSGLERVFSVSRKLLETDDRGLHTCTSSAWNDEVIVKVQEQRVRRGYEGLVELGVS